MIRASLRERLIKIGTKVVSHGQYVTFQMAEVAVPRQMFQEILSLIAGSGRRPRRHDREIGEMRRPATAEVRLDLKAKRRVSALRGQASRHFGCQPVGCDRISLWCASLSPTDRQSGECRLKWRCSGALRETRARCRCGRLSQRL